MRLFFKAARLLRCQRRRPDIQPDPTRFRKLLLHRDQLDKLIGQGHERKRLYPGPTAVCWKHGRGRKVEIGLAKASSCNDKRADR